MHLAATKAPLENGQKQERKQRQSMIISDKRKMNAENNFGMPR